MRCGSSSPARTRAKELMDKELIALAESVFEYLYVVPKDVERRRNRLCEGQASTAETGPQTPAGATAPSDVS